MLLSESDYLEGERFSDVKHELIDGQAYAMAGASANHDRIAKNMARKFGDHLENSRCEPFGPDMKIKVGACPRIDYSTAEALNLAILCGPFR